MRKTICMLLIFVLVLSFCSCGKKDFSKMSIEEKVEYRISEMTIEEKIAQMMIVYYTGDSVDDTLLSVIRSVKPGGFILTADNITTYEKTKSFVQSLQENSEIPMIISIDQEGGLVQRLSCLTDVTPTNIPNMLSVGNFNDTQFSYNIGKVMAEELRTIGVNLTFAPVVDVLPQNGESFIGTRSFGSNVEIVSSMSTAIAKGLEENGIIATYKHFPGHGDTTTDSHTSLPVVCKTKDELFSNELIPFENAIKNNAKIIMIGHIALPEIIGDSTPASLSKEIVTDLLKTEMGFNGLVVTDALNMGALTNEYSYEEIYVKSIEAGVDLLLMPNGSKKAIEIIKQNVSEERIDQSVRKILNFKYTYLEQELILDKSYLGSDEHKKIAELNSLK